MTNSMTKKCNFCREDIPVDLTRCPYCGSLLEISSYNEDNTIDIDETPSHKDSMEEKIGHEGSLLTSDNMDSSRAQEEIQTEIQTEYQTEPQRESQTNANITEDFSCTEANQRIACEKNTAESDLGEWGKLIISAISVLIPGIGQIIGVIAAIHFMNSEDKVRKSFGLNLMIASITIFILFLVGFFILGIALADPFV